ncbi:uncharacterized protein [Amphiura filiformis]|uniref:uncharacterized protein n=1 Tax=Amphiura filiformis TaxID=82378 RepID=UPI003B21572C
MAGDNKGKSKSKSRNQKKNLDTDTAIVDNPPDLSLDLEELVPRAVEHLLKTSAFKQLLEKSLVSTIQAKIETMEEKIAKQDSILFDLQSELKQKSDENNKLKVQIKDLTENTDETARKLNDLEQYTRRNSIRLFGIPESKGKKENCDAIVTNLARDKLGVKVDLQEIDRCHRVGKKTSEPGKKPRPIIVKFATYRSRQKVMIVRKKLKGTGITIKEDLTRANQTLLEQVSRVEEVISSWSSDGRILALVKRDGKEEIRPVSTLEDLHLK